MKTQILHKMKYDLKGGFNVMESFRDCFFQTFSPNYNPDLRSYEQLMPLFY